MTADDDSAADEPSARAVSVEDEVAEILADAGIDDSDGDSDDDSNGDDSDDAGCSDDEEGSDR